MRLDEFITEMDVVYTVVTWILGLLILSTSKAVSKSDAIMYGGKACAFTSFVLEFWPNRWAKFLPTDEDCYGLLL